MDKSTHYSDYYHSKFLERFKGKISTIDKTGHLGVASNASKPIMKPLQTYSEIYTPATTYGKYTNSQFGAATPNYQSYYTPGYYHPATGSESSKRKSSMDVYPKFCQSTMQKAAVFSLRGPAHSLLLHSEPQQPQKYQKYGSFVLGGSVARKMAAQSAEKMIISTKIAPYNVIINPLRHGTRNDYLVRTQTLKEPSSKCNKLFQ